MTQYRLVYFDGKSRGELIRWMLKFTKQDFEDVRVSFQEWSQIKQSTTFGQVPTLEIDGKMYCQSLDICRYLANKYGYNGDTLEDKAHADMIVDFCEDMVITTEKIFLEPDTKVKQQIRKDYENKELPKHLNYLETALKQNKQGHDWFIGNKITWTDVVVTLYTTAWMEPVEVSIDWDNYPLLNSLKERVLAVLQVQ